MRGRYETVDGVRVYCQTDGSGPPLVLLHGFLLSGRSWHAVLPRLRERFTVHTVDLPGFGESDRPAAYSYSVDAYVHTVAGLLDALDLSRVSVVGHSLGGGLAVLLAARYPERVRRAVLVAPYVYSQKLAPEVRLALIPIIGEIFFKKLYRRRDLERFLRRNAYLDPGLPTEEELQFYWERLTRPGGLDAAHRVLRELARPDALTEAVRRVSCPVLVVRGERDRVVPRSMVERLAEEIPHAEQVTISATRHCPMEERPDAFSDAVLPFLEAS